MGSDVGTRELRAALDLLADGDWEAAHRIVQDMDGPEAAWIHAHLHRIEGDLPNARYWYARAGREPQDGPLEHELAALRRHFSG